MDVTSNQAKMRWNDAHYVQVKVSVQPEIAAAFKAKCLADGVSMASVLSHYMAQHCDAAKQNAPPADYSTRRKRRTAVKRILRELEQIKAAEELLISNAPENLQTAPVYETADQYASALEETIGSLTDVY
jgi:hypothetical protein